MTNEQIDAVARAIANTKVDPYSTIQHALNTSPLIDGTALGVRQEVGAIIRQAAKAAIAATHEQYKPLVEALRKVMDVAGDFNCTQPANALVEYITIIAYDALANLPEELRG